MPKGGSRAGAGRKVIPISEKMERGTFRPHREKDTPTPTDKRPSPPTWLTPAAKSIFRILIKRISNITIASQDHTDGIAVLASRLEEVQRLDKYLNQVGYTYEQKAWVGRGDNAHEITTAIRPRPEVNQRDKAMRHLHSLLLDYGLTPSSLSRVKPREYVIGNDEVNKNRFFK